MEFRTVNLFLIVSVPLIFIEHLHLEAFFQRDGDFFEEQLFCITISQFYGCSLCAIILLFLCFDYTREFIFGYCIVSLHQSIVYQSHRARAYISPEV